MVTSMQWPLMLALMLSQWQSNGFTTLHPSHHHLSKDTSLSRLSLSWIDKKGKPSYSDGFLLVFHNSAQKEMQSETNDLLLWNEKLEEEEFSFLEWQDAFHRNGFSDFCPPMSSHLNCLMVGEGMAGQTARSGAPGPQKLPWEEQAEAAITALRVMSTATTEDGKFGDSDLVISDASTDNNKDNDATIVIHTEQVRASSNTDASSSSGLSMPCASGHAAVYDCVIDQGLIEAVLALNDAKAIQELTMEAATAIREHGIYVLITTQPLTNEQKEWLHTSGVEAGLEWEVELDGISDRRRNQIVSVARRFNTGAMPKVGKLSRYQP